MPATAAEPMSPTLATVQGRSPVPSRLDLLEGQLAEQQRLIAEQRRLLEAQREALQQQRLRVERLEAELTRQSDGRSGAYGAAPVPAGFRLNGGQTREFARSRSDSYLLAQGVVPRAPIPVQPVAPAVEPEPEPQPQPPRPVQAAPRPAPPPPAPPPPVTQAPPAKPTPPADGPPAARPGPTGTVPAATEAPGEAPGRIDAERPESEAPMEQLLLEAGGVLLPQGTLQIEPGLEYTHTSGSRIAISGFSILDAILIGRLRVDDLNRDIVTQRTTARLGVTNRFQVETTVPIVYRTDSETLGLGTADQETSKTTGFGLGDVEATASYQVLDRAGWIPGLVVRARGRFPTGKSPFDIETRQTEGNRAVLDSAPTGSGFYGVNPGLTAVWRTDPVIFFAGGGYTFNLPRTEEETGKIDPGDTYNWFVGMNLALTEVVSVNFSFVNEIIQKSKQNGVKRPGSGANDARLLAGASISLSDRTVMLVTAQAGLTDDSPDFSFTASFPTNFSLF